MTQAKAKARANKTNIVQPSPMIVAYDCQNVFIVQATRCVHPIKTLYACFIHVMEERIFV